MQCEACAGRAFQAAAAMYMDPEAEQCYDAQAALASGRVQPSAGLSHASALAGPSREAAHLGVANCEQSSAVRPRRPLTCELLLAGQRDEAAHQEVAIGALCHINGLLSYLLHQSLAMSRTAMLGAGLDDARGRVRHGQRSHTPRDLQQRDAGLLDRHSRCDMASAQDPATDGMEDGRKQCCSTVTNLRSRLSCSRTQHRCSDKTGA